MSKTIYKIEFEYDDNYGNCYQPISKSTCYEIINNIDDYIRVVNEKGNCVILSNSESFIANLSYCLNKPPFEDIINNYKMSKKEIDDIPTNILKKIYDY